MERTVAPVINTGTPQLEKKKTRKHPSFMMVTWQKKNRSIDSPSIGLREQERNSKLRWKYYIIQEGCFLFTVTLSFVPFVSFAQNWTNEFSTMFGVLVIVGCRDFGLLKAKKKKKKSCLLFLFSKECFDMTVTMKLYLRSYSYQLLLGRWPPT